MKQINLFKKVVLVSFLCATGAANAQVMQPLSFGAMTVPGGTTPTNWYANYVGLRCEVDAPAAIAGSKAYTVANDGSGATGTWGGVVTTPIVNVPIYMPDSGASTGADSSGCSAFDAVTAAAMNGKIAVIWRGPISGACDFGCKVLNAQNAGAIAVVLINEYPGQGPVGMGASTTCTGQTIPVFMVGNLDGIAISAQYRAGVPVTMTLTTWGQNLNNDLGFVPGGVADWHAYAVPQSQLVSNGNPATYMGLDGGFVANYGNHDATNVRLAATMTFTQTGGSPVQIHTDTSAKLSQFTVADSIYTFFAPSKYNLTPESNPGQYTVTYNILQDSINQLPADVVASYSFFSTDSVFSKGTYNFNATPPQPARTAYYNLSNTSTGEFLWGPMYYVANAGLSLSTVQYSIASAINPTTDVANPLNGPNNVYLFQWVDGRTDSVSGTVYPLDSIVEYGELEIVSLGIKNYTDVSDTDEGLITLTTMGDTNGNPAQVVLGANSWYYLAVDVPSTAANPEYLGADGVLDPYPRVYGIYNNNSSGLLDYANIAVSGNQDSLWSDAEYGNPPFPFSATAYINSVDSFNYNNAKGLIPSVAMTTMPTTTGVNKVSIPYANVSLYPNPASDYINVSVTLPQQAHTVSYEIIDGLGRFVSKVVHNNVLSEVANLSTTNLAPGNYFMIIGMDNKLMSRKFTVTK